MKIAEHRHTGAVVLAPAGVVAGSDAECLGQRLAELAENESDRIVVDFAMVTQVDSRALEVLLDAAEKLIRRGRALAIANPSETVREVFDITQVISLFEQHKDIDHAIGSQA